MPNFARSLKMVEENCGLTPQDFNWCMLDIFSFKASICNRKGTCRISLWKRCIRKHAYGIWEVFYISDCSIRGDWTFKAAQPFLKQKHSRMQNLPKKSLKPCSSPVVNYQFTFDIYDWLTKYIGLCTLVLNTPRNLHSQSPLLTMKPVNDVCRVFQRFSSTIRMHEWPRNQANLHASEQVISMYFCTYFSWVMDCTELKLVRSFVQSVAPRQVQK